jgi:DNA-binding transcriptional LysR family regulator
MVIVITQRRLQHLLTLMEHAHFGRAATALNISQPALTKSIQGLEAELGVTLLDRKHDGVVLTVFGDLVAKRSKTWLTAEDDLRREIAMLVGSDIGSLKVALGPYPSITSGFPAAARLLARHPTIRISVGVAAWREVATQVNALAVDLGIAELSNLHGHEQFAKESIGQHRGYFFCRPGHPLLACAQVTLPQLLEYPWVSSRLPPRVASGFPQKLGAAGSIDPINGDFVPAIEVDVPLQLSGFITDSDAVTVTMLAAMQQELHSGKVALLPTVNLPIGTDYGFIYLKNRSLPPAALAYMDEVRTIEAEIAKREASLAARYCKLTNQAATENP